MMNQPHVVSWSAVLFIPLETAAHCSFDCQKRERLSMAIYAASFGFQNTNSCVFPSTVKWFAQIYHSHFSISINRRHCWIKTPFGQASESYAEELIASFKC